MNEKLIELCKNLNEENISVFEEECLGIKDLKESFGDEVKCEPWEVIKIPLFDKALEANIAKLSDKTLSHLISVSYSQDSFNSDYKITNIVLEESIRRRSSSIQIAMVDTFLRTKGYYMAGDREFDDTVYDMFVDNFSPRFEEESMADLLCRIDAEIIIEDGFYDRFNEYFAKATNKETSLKVLSIYKKILLKKIVDGLEEKEVFDEIKSFEKYEIIKDEVLSFSDFINLYIKGFVEYEQEKTVELLEFIAEESNANYIELLPWDNIFEGKRIEDKINIDFELGYKAFIKSIDINDRRNRSCDFFFSLLYIIDSKKLKENSIRDIKDSKDIGKIWLTEVFKFDLDDFYFFKAIVIGLIDGEKEEEIVKRLEEKKAKEETKKRAEEKEKQLKENLCKAILVGDISTVQNYLELKGSFEEITMSDNKGYNRPILEVAAMAESKKNGTEEITKFILENVSVEKQAEAIHTFASEDYYLPYAKLLLEAGVEPDLMQNNTTPLQLAVGNKNPKMMHLLLSYGADPEKDGEYGSVVEKVKYDDLYKPMIQSAIVGEVKTLYYFIDLEKIKEKFITWMNSIQVFGKENREKEFYILSIDAGMLRTNTEKAFQETLKEYAYTEEKEIKSLKYNSGDFSFTIPILKEEVEIEEMELDFSFLEARENENRIEKEILRDGLECNKELISKYIKLTENFKIEACSHVY